MANTQIGCGRIAVLIAGGVVKAFQLAYGIANDGRAAADGLPKNPIARPVFVKIAQGYLPVSHEHFSESLSVVPP